MAWLAESETSEDAEPGPQRKRAEFGFRVYIGYILELYWNGGK